MYENVYEKYSPTLEEWFCLSLSSLFVSSLIQVSIIVVFPFIPCVSKLRYIIIPSRKKEGEKVTNHSHVLSISNVNVYKTCFCSTHSFPKGSPQLFSLFLSPLVYPIKKSHIRETCSLSRASVCCVCVCCVLWWSWCNQKWTREQFEPRWFTGERKREWWVRSSFLPSSSSFDFAAVSIMIMKRRERERERKGIKWNEETQEQCLFNFQLLNDCPNESLFLFLSLFSRFVARALLPDSLLGFHNPILTMPWGEQHNSIFCFKIFRSLFTNPDMNMFSLSVVEESYEKWLWGFGKRGIWNSEIREERSVLFPPVCVSLCIWLSHSLHFVCVWNVCSLLFTFSSLLPSSFLLLLLRFPKRERKRAEKRICEDWSDFDLWWVKWRERERERERK